MKFSMNGYRRNNCADIETLRDLVVGVLAGGNVDDEVLAEAMNQVITNANVLNCVFQTDDPDFVEMGDLEVEHIETESADCE